MRDGILHRALGDLVEHHAFQFLPLEQLLALENLHDVPRNSFTLAVRVGREEYLVCLLHGLGDRIHMLGVLFDHLVLHGEVVLGIHRALLGDQVAHVAIGGQHLEVTAQVFFKGLRLGRRLYDQKGGSHALARRWEARDDKNLPREGQGRLNDRRLRRHPKGDPPGKGFRPCDPASTGPEGRSTLPPQRRPRCPARPGRGR